MNFGDDACRLAIKLETGPAAQRITTCEDVFADLPVEKASCFTRHAEDEKPLAPAVLRSMARVSITAPATQSGIEYLVVSAITHQDALDVPTPRLRQPARLLVRALLPNLLSESGDIHLVQSLDKDCLRIAIRAERLNFSRFGNVSNELAIRALEVELASVLNLGWFEKIEVTPDGTGILFTSHG